MGWSSRIRARRPSRCTAGAPCGRVGCPGVLDEPSASRATCARTTSSASTYARVLALRWRARAELEAEPAAPLPNLRGGGVPGARGLVSRIRRPPRRGRRRGRARADALLRRPPDAAQDLADPHGPARRRVERRGRVARAVAQPGEQLEERLLGAAPRG